MVITYADLPKIRKSHPGACIVYISGTFDLIHIGHIKVLELAKLLGDILVVSVQSDKASAKYKHKAPLIPEDQRAKVVDSLKPVDYVVINKIDPNHEYNELGIIKRLRPNIFATAYADLWKQYATELRKYTQKVVPLMSGIEIHTTDILLKSNQQSL